MPIKFPRFSRRKSVGNSIEGSGYQPANTGSPIRPGFEEDDLQHHPDGANPYGGYSTQQRYNSSNPNNYNNSGTISGSGYSGGYYGSGSSNRLSSSSTLPSSDAPRTPASTDDHFGPQKTEKSTGGSGLSGYSSHRDFDTSSQSGSTFVSKRSVGGQYPTAPPKRMALASAEPPRLETQLDSSSFEDMFSGFGTTGSGMSATPAAPKLATSSLLPSVKTGSTPEPYNSIMVSPSAKNNTGSNNTPPAPPPKSYNPANSPTNLKPSGIVAQRVNTFNAKLTPAQNMYSEAESPSSERWHGRPSEEALMDTSPPHEVEEPKLSPRQSRNLTHQAQPDRPSHARKDSLTAPPKNTRPPGRQHISQTSSDTGSSLRRSVAVPRRKSVPVEDEDANLVMNNVQRTQTQQFQRNTGPRNLTDKVKGRDSGWEEALASGSSSANSFRDNSSASSRDTGQTSISNRTPAASRKNTDENFTSVKILSSSDSTINARRNPVDYKDNSDTELDTSMLAAANLAAQYESESARATTEQQSQVKKVMTKAQFERYRQQQDEERRLGGKVVDDSSDSNDSEDEEESETERNRELARQRAKQEAHLSVYRQQMMKITGSTSEGPLGTNTAASSSTPMLPFNNSMPQLSLSGPASNDGGSDGEDEEVPLGILMAHGFPNKNRPPTRLSNSSSQPNLRQASQLSAMDPRLPVFARNLPADPYNYGAGLVNAPNRVPLGFGGGDARSVAGGSVYGGMSEAPSGRPGGLIGEIALAEEQKAARRGSPLSAYRPVSAAGVGRISGNGGGMLGLGGGMQGMGMGQNMMGIQSPQMMPPPPTINAPPMGADPMQMQMANQMQQMMQMQMQWMQMQQQMMQNGQPMLNPGMMGMPRPNSMVVPQTAPNMGMHQRTMSMVDPGIPQFGPQMRPGYAPSIAPSQMGPMMMGMSPGYTPSIAPSERSTIGLPSRYRPVSTVPAVINSSRTSTMTSAMGAAWGGTKSVGTGSALKNATTKGRDSDDDDDSAWEELEKKKREKKDGWRKKKEGQLKSIFTS